MRPLLLSALLAFAIGAAGLGAAGLADEPFLRPNDVIALVGGEDMVAAAEYGYLELLLTRALPAHKLKFRCLAWEGDTVFEQPRQLNYPKLEQQLNEIGATVVICQFGHMESLAGKEKLPEFISAYEKLIARFSAGGKRRIVIVSPRRFQHLDASPDFTTENGDIEKYALALRKLADSAQARFIHTSDLSGGQVVQDTRDGVHGNYHGIYDASNSIALALEEKIELLGLADDGPPEVIKPPRVEALRQLIIAKNRLWFDYYRPQNWAFLAGDRTTQASSRDHLDPSKRWFPPEREQFLPLIEKKEQEIWALAASLK